MNKNFVIGIGIVLVIGTALFFDQVLALFAGLSPIEALRQIWTFVLHVTVGTICAYVAFGLPALIKPWMRMFRQKRRDLRRGRAGQAVLRSPKLDVNRLLAQLYVKQQTGQSAKPTPRPLDDSIKLDF